MKLKSVICLFTSICLIFLSSCNTGGTGDISSAAAKGETAASSLVQSENTDADSSTIIQDEGSPTSSNSEKEDADKLIGTLTDAIFSKIYIFDKAATNKYGYELEKLVNSAEPLLVIDKADELKKFKDSLKIEKWQYLENFTKTLMPQKMVYINDNIQICILEPKDNAYRVRLIIGEQKGICFVIPDDAYSQIQTYIEK